MLGGETYLIRYNNRLDIVVYAPEGVEVRYHVVDRWGGEPKWLRKVEPATMERQLPNNGRLTYLLPAVGNIEKLDFTLFQSVIRNTSLCTEYLTRRRKQ
jgi:hypothetical protein